jgi:hypothetical protein
MLGSEFQDYGWKDIADVHVKEVLLGAEFTITCTGGKKIVVDYLPKEQARLLYQFAQEMEELQKMEKAKPPPLSGSKEDPTESLQKLKKLLDEKLITRAEFDSKKAEILSRL